MCAPESTVHRSPGPGSTPVCVASGPLYDRRARGVNKRPPAVGAPPRSIRLMSIGRTIGTIDDQQVVAANQPVAFEDPSSKTSPPDILLYLLIGLICLTSFYVVLRRCCGMREKRGETEHVAEGEEGEPRGSGSRLALPRTMPSVVTAAVMGGGVGMMGRRVTAADADDRGTGGLRSGALPVGRVPMYA